jgi:cell division protease FtsH
MEDKRNDTEHSDKKGKGEFDPKRLDSHDRPGKDIGGGSPGPKSQIAIIVWLLLIAALGIFFMMRKGSEPVAKWDWSKFEKELAAGNIESIVMTPLDDKLVSIDGKYKLVPKNGGEAVGREFHVKGRWSDDLDSLLDSYGVKRSVKQRSRWTELIMTILPFLIIVGIIYFLFSRQMKMAGKGAMQFGKSRARMFAPDKQKITFDDVAGAEEAKEETKELIDYLKDPLKFKILGGKIPKGALLVGPPGTGKTLIAKAIAGEAEVPFFTISGSDFVEMFVGVGASRVRDMFEQARRHAPCLLFIDEIDAVGRSRFSGIGGGHDEREQTLNALLVEMDGMETQEGVIILAATNRPDVLDPALMRPGRFDRQIVLDLPDIKGRKAILEVHSERIKLSEGIDLEIIAKSTPGFSGADLANLINEAALLAARQDKKAAEMDDLEEARDKVRWGRERRSRKLSDEERKITAYHEAGHALVALHCPKAMPLHKVTIIPRGMAYLGATMSLPEEDRYTESKTEMLDELTVLMGGRCAEQAIFGEITSGAAGDIHQATKIARNMVCVYGMSDKLGTVQYGSRNEHIYLGRDIVKNEDYSEETAREIDLEIKKFIDGAAKQANAILKTHRKKLELLADTLLERETLDVKEIKKLLGYDDTSPAAA